jgi:DNA-binding CsgD family transcriptional regulator/type II secretory pathway predicted ATPase ExeA
MGHLDVTVLGREQELRTILGRLEDGHAVVQGDAGVGKTTVVRRVVAELRGAGRAVHDAVATRAAASVPFGPLLSLLPDDRDRAGALTDASAARQLLAELARIGPRPVLVVDDAHLLDDPTATVVFEAARAGAVQVLVSLRAGEPVPDAIAALWKDGGALVIELDALSPTQTGALLEQLLGDRVEQHTVERLWTTTQGNPLFVRELAAGARRTGALQQFEGMWVLRGDIDVDRRLADAVLATIGSLDPTVRAVAELVSAGELVPLTVLEALVDIDAIAAAEDAGVIVVDPDTSVVAIAHPLQGEVLRAGLAAARVRQLRATLAQQSGPTIETTSRSGPRSGSRSPVGVDPLLRAVWVLDGGAPVEPALFVDAARTALGLQQHDLARRLGNAVLAAGPDPAAAVMVAIAANRQHDPDGALAAIDGCARRPVDGALGFQLAVEETNARFWVRADIGGADAALQDWAAAITEQPWHDMVLGLQATVLLWSGEAARAEAIGAPLITPDNDPRVRAIAFGAMAYLLISYGRTDEVIAIATELLGPAVALREVFPDAVLHVATPYVAALAQQGRLDEVDRLVELVDTVLDGESSELLRAMTKGVRGIVALLRGRCRTARALLEESLAVQLAAGHDWRTGAAYAALAEACSMCGDRGAAERAVTRARDTMGANERGLTFGIELATVWATFVRDGAPEATRVASQCARAARQVGYPLQELLFQFDLLRLGSADGVARVLEVGPRVDGPLPAAMVAMARAVAGRDGPALDAAAASFGALGTNLYAAEAAVMAADAHRRQGDAPAAARSDAAAHEWAQQCEGARSAILELRQPAVAVLTAREREIVQLAARGRSNRDVADELCVSVRTVEGHLARAYAKLGVTNRQQLAGLLG